MSLRPKASATAKHPTSPLSRPITIVHSTPKLAFFGVPRSNPPSPISYEAATLRGRQYASSALAPSSPASSSSVRRGRIWRAPFTLFHRSPGRHSSVPQEKDRRFSPRANEEKGNENAARRSGSEVFREQGASRSAGRKTTVCLCSNAFIRRGQKSSY